MGNTGIACYEQFLLFPWCFKKNCTADTYKQGLVSERVNVHVVDNILKITGNAELMMYIFYNEKSLGFLHLRSRDEFFTLFPKPFTPLILILIHQQQTAFENIVGKEEIVFQTAFENIVGKEEIARNEQFLLFPQCFLLN